MLGWDGIVQGWLEGEFRVEGPRLSAEATDTCALGCLEVKAFLELIQNTSPAFLAVKYFGSQNFTFSRALRAV